MTSVFNILIPFMTFFADSFYIHGRLVDHQYNPIESFILKTYQSNEKNEYVRLIRTDTIRHVNGEFKVIKLEAGRYLLKIEVPDYTGYTFCAEIKDANQSFPDICLQPSR